MDEDLDKYIREAKRNAHRIWKKQDCKAGECKGVREFHRLSVPACVPGGLSTECLDCGKTRLVEVEQNTNLNPLS